MRGVSLGDGSPQAGSRGKAQVVVWGEAPRSCSCSSWCVVAHQPGPQSGLITAPWEWCRNESTSRHHRAW